MNKVYYVGYSAVHPDTFTYDVADGFDCYLLIITTTPVSLRLQGKKYEYPAHTAILYPPHTPIWYGACGESYGNHWLRFASDESFVTNFPQFETPFIVSDPQYCLNLLQLLTWESSQLGQPERIYQNTGIIMETRDSHLKHLATDAFQKDFTISQLLRILFTKLSCDLTNSPSTSHDHELLALRRQISSNPQLEWNIPSMADELHISPGHLQLLYKEKFHISCMDDVIQFRLVKARDLLRSTTLSIAEIAEQCGYHNIEHFCRQFRKQSDLTPGQYRRHTQKQPTGR